LSGRGGAVISWSTSDVAGVNFGDSHITVTRVCGKPGGTLTLTHAGWVAYDPGAPEKDVTAALKRLWREARVPTRTVVASLRSAALVVRYFKYPTMPPLEVQSALRLQAEECLQIAGDQLVVDSLVNVELPGGGSGTQAMIEGVLAAAPLKDVERLLRIAVAAGLDPITLDVRAMAVANVYAVLGERNDDPTTCVVNLSPHSADVIILTKAGAIYPHTVFCRATTWAEAPAFLCENVRDVMKYSEFKLDWEPVRRVILTGEVPTSDGFLTKVQEGVRLPVDGWDPLKRLNVKNRRVKEVLADRSVNPAILTSSLGLALRRD
jgi:Tfp pilus assembly PilM family ATPase